MDAMEQASIESLLWKCPYTTNLSQRSIIATYLYISNTISGNLFKMWAFSCLAIRNSSLKLCKFIPAIKCPGVIIKVNTGVTWLINSPLTSPKKSKSAIALDKWLLWLMLLNVFECCVRFEGQSLGYAFVRYQSPSNALRAIQAFNGLRLQNKTIKVIFLLLFSFPPSSFPYYSLSP